MQVLATVPAFFRALSQPLVQLRRGNHHLMREGKSHLGSRENHSHLKPLAVPCITKPHYPLWAQ
jgi:hypothetical protein